MNESKPMPLILIEDDVAECVRFRNCISNRTDVTFVGMTGSSVEAMNYVKTKLPEGIILDLELQKGKGSGLQFLADLKNTTLALRPIVIVTTNVQSNIVYNHVHDVGVEFVFCKRQADYSHEMVINTMLTLRKSLHTLQHDDMPSDLMTSESPEERRLRILERIGKEMDLVGIGLKYTGRAYLIEAIMHLVNMEKNNSEAVINEVALSRKLTYNNVQRPMQTAINNAWKCTCIEDLQIHYTARIDYNKGVPTPSEFIHYYADKIRKTM